MVVAEGRPTTAQCGTLPNTATVSATFDTNTNNNSSTATIFVACPAITLTKTADVLSVDAKGDKITYTITVKNTGNTTLNVADVSVSDPRLPRSTARPAPSKRPSRSAAPWVLHRHLHRHPDRPRHQRRRRRRSEQHRQRHPRRPRPRHRRHSVAVVQATDFTITKTAEVDGDPETTNDTVDAKDDVDSPTPSR